MEPLYSIRAAPVNSAFRPLPRDRTDRRDRIDYPRCPDFRDVWVFSLEWPLDKIILQENETCAAKWKTCDEIYAMMERGVFIGKNLFDYVDELFEKSAQGLKNKANPA